MAPTTTLVAIIKILSLPFTPPYLKKPGELSKVNVFGWLVKFDRYITAPIFFSVCIERVKLEKFCDYRLKEH